MSDDNAGLSDYLKQLLEINQKQLREINQKLDRLVRLEERQATHDDSIKRAFDRIEKCEDRVRVLEISDGKVEIKTGHSSAFQSSVTGAAIAVLVSIVVWAVKSNGA